MKIQITENDIKHMVQSVINEMIAYHGAAANFNKFDEKHVGNGEGGQMYGWGTYVTTNPETAKHYANVAMGTNNKANGTLYQVEIPDDNGSNYINIQGNPPAVYTNIEKILLKEYPECDANALHELIKYCRDRNHDNLDWLFSQITSCGIPYRGLSKALDRNGIVGVRVPVQYREAGVGDNGYNYTIFRSKNVRIVNKSKISNEGIK